MSKIGVIDTGIDSNRLTKKISYEVVNIKNVTIQQPDSIGHGTAVTYLIDCYSEVENYYYIFNIFGEEENSTEDKLILTLEYIFMNLELDIIHISNGILRPQKLKRLESIVKKLSDKKVVIVSAFDNAGANSYPACLNEVIGISISSRCANIHDYIVSENSPVDVLATSTKFKIPFYCGGMDVIQGSSFSASVITAKISNLIYKYRDIEEALLQFKRMAKEKDVFDCVYKKTRSLDVKDIEKAIIFPVNKEMHSLLGNSDQLHFDIVGVYDFPYSNNIGRSPMDFIFGSCPSELKIKSIFDLSDGDYDTIIVGHFQKIGSFFKIDFVEKFVDFCLKQHKKLFFCDDVSEHIIFKENSSKDKLSFYFNQNVYIEPNSYGKLYKLSSPTLVVCGTSPKQGKFNVQLDLRKRFLRDRYVVRQMGTEPTSLLFGMDRVYCNGYSTNIKCDNSKEIFTINRILKDIDDGDVLIIGTQSQIVNYSFGNCAFYTHSQINVLLASEPDLAVLCVNDIDEIQFVKKTIIFLQEIMMIKVVSIIVYEQKSDPYLASGYCQHQLYFREDIIGKYRDSLCVSGRRIPIFINGNESDMQKNYEIIIEEFGGTL